MALVRKTITVTEQQEAWMKAELESGRYGNDSELIRDLIRERQDRSADIDLIRAKLIAGEQSDFTTASAEDLKADVKDRAKRDGKL